MRNTLNVAWCSRLADRQGTHSAEGKIFIQGCAAHGFLSDQDLFSKDQSKRKRFDFSISQKYSEREIHPSALLGLREELNPLGLIHPVQQLISSVAVIISVFTKVRDEASRTYA